MFKRRKRKGGSVAGSQSDGPSRPPLSPPAPTPVSPPPNPEANARQRAGDAFKSVCERAADLVKSEVASTGKIRPTAIFVYENDASTPEASTTKVVSLVWNGEIQKEALIRRIKEKALLEKASAVLLLAEADPEQRSSPRRQGVLMLSGVTPGVSLSARVDYTVDKETKSINSWEIRWLQTPVQNVFLDGIFPMERGPV
ncbi:MAG TPA: hypothetical protein VKF36_01285 [Syntrophorhabdales bacterium]|nr:hypothetical protein [Syntrophorhabdales bacterium]